MSRTRTPVVPVLLLALLTVIAAGCGGSSSDSGGDGSAGKLSLVAYSTPKEAYAEIVPAFNKTPEGKDVGFDQSYGSSGEQSRAIEGGLNADIAALSLQPDVDKLVEAGLVAEDWNQDEFDGFVTNSVVVFATRKGNPKKIRTWEDLTKSGVEVITPNPFTSGGAKWNLMAAYGAALQRGESEADAEDFLARLLKNVPVQDKSARESLQTFTGGKGDVLIAYENEAIAAQQAGEEVDYVIPDETILIENPAAVLEDGNKQKAQAFLDFVRSEPAQEIFAEKGYRSILPELVNEKTYPRPAKLFEIDKLGGWDAVNAKFFDPDDSVVADINRELGQSLGD